MNVYQVTLTAGGFAMVAGENYNDDPVTGLVVVDQFGNAVQTFAAGSYSGIAVVGAVGLPNPPPNAGGIVNVDADTNVPG